jgi:uncharacterized SAM-dependent methyltransferase
VCDLVSVESLEPLIGSHTPPDATRIITFFGMLPNLEANLVLPKVAALLRPGDRLLLSANLARAENYQASLQSILKQYDNQLTNDWLMIFPNDLGLHDGVLRWNIEPSSANAELFGFVAWLEMRELNHLTLDDQDYTFKQGERIRLFASWRYTPALMETELAKVNLRLLGQWITPSGEEGVFLVTRNS